MVEAETTDYEYEDPGGDGRVDDNVSDDSEIELTAEEIPKFDIEVSQEAKLRELLRNINSAQAEFASDSLRELVKLFRVDSSGDLLRYYVRTSSKLMELQDAWKLRRGKPGFKRILRLVSEILDHPEGRYVPNDAGRITISRALDKFSKLILEENLNDVYEELKSKDKKRQRRALSLMTSIVRRGSVLADEVARSFDFKLPVFLKLAKHEKETVGHRKEVRRDAFIEFAMSFLEVGKPGLLRWVLQQKEMFFGVLRGLKDDDEENIVYVLSTLRDRVLVPESLIPPGLRSVLFGSVTLDQLMKISEGENGVLAAKIAYDVLVMVCTDPSNGLMPDLKMSSLKGNQKRLLGLMKNLKATEVQYHRDLLLAIVKGRPSLGSAYLDEFPYKCEDPSSATWIAAVSLAADLVSSISTGICWDFLDHLSHQPSAFQDLDLQCVLRCICACPFGRLVINKGLLHSDPLVKHVTLRLLLEILKLLGSLIDALSLNESTPLKQEIQNDVRVLLPDPQVLFALLSSLNNFYCSPQTSLKRLANSEAAGKKKKKLKMDTLNDDVDIVLGVTNSANDLDLLQDIDKTGAPNRKDVPDGGSHRVKFAEVWGLYQCSSSSNAEEDENVYFHCKLLEVLKLYHRIFHTVLEVSYDFFKIIPGNPLALPRTLLQSLLSALIDHISWPLEFGLPCGSLPPFYKYLQHFINLLLYSPIREIKDESYVLARAAMLSTGAFDSNEMEVGTWFLFLPGYSGHNAQTEDQECDFFQNLSPVVVSFLCDAVSSVGNNLLKYWDRVKSYLNCSEDCKDLAVHFSPLVICVLEKCLRLLNAESATFTSPERTMISLYVSNTLKYILQTQVEANLLSSLIHQFLLEKSEDGFLAADLEKLSCEWRPMKYLFSFSKSILKGGTCNSLAVDRSALCSNSSFVSIVSEVKKMLRRGCHSELVGVSKAFYFSLVCTTPNEIIENLPSVLMISENLLGIRPLLTSLIFLDPNSFARIYKLFPDILSFSVGVGAASTLDEQKQNHCIGMTIYSLLSQAPFHVLLPAIIIGDYQDHCSRMKELLSAKLSSLTADLLLPSLMLILFWIYQANLSFRQHPSPASQSGIISAQCYALVENILQLLPVKADTCFSTVAGSSVSMQRGLHICKTLISHPAIFSSLSCPPTYGDELVEELLRDILEGAPCLSGRRASKKDQSVLSLLTVASDYLLGMCSSQNSVTVNVGCSDKIGKVFKRWVQLVFRMLRKRLDLYVETLDLTFVAPALYVILAFMRIISPFDLLGLVNWFFCRADLKDPLMWRTSNVSPFYLGFCIAGGALEMLSRCLGGAGSRLLCESKGQSSDVRLLENLYFRAVEFSTRYRLDVADVCFLNFVSASRWSEHRQDLLPLCMKMARMVASTPIEILYHCIDDINPVKSKLLLYVIEISPLHMSTFGLVLSNTLNGSSMKGAGGAYLSDEGYLMLLPAAFSYINSSLTKFGNQYAKKLGSIISFYSRILTAGFGNWRSFVDQAIFQVEYTEVLPSSSDELLDLVNKSHVGKAVHMLQYDFTLNGVSMDERLRLFLSISPCSELLDLDIRDKDSCSVEQSLNSIIRLVANICLSKILLFPRIYQNRFLLKEGDIGDDHPDTLSIRMDSARLRFLDTLVSVWQSIVKKVPSTIDTSGKKIELWLLFKYLEVFISRSISELIMEMHDALVQLDSLPFLEEIAKFSLLHRFGDLGTFKMLQCMLSSLSEGNLPTVKFLQLFLSHSQLGLTIRTASGSANVDVPGVFLKPISSILRSVIIPTEKSTTTNYSVKLETTKLLRMLFYLKSHARGSLSENDIGINSGGLLFLLLSSYGATLSEIDLKIYSLMVEIESAETSSLKLAELDYLWGSALLRTRGEQAHEFDSLPHNFMPEMEGDYRRSQFRDNLPIDPKLCIATVLHYPFERTTSDDCLSLEKFLQNNARNESKIHSAEGERITCYDPVFILRFSIHCLSMDFLDSVEFAGLGLLAIALMSMSSPDEGIRKLAYEVLGKFRDGLEKCRKKRESTRLRLLLTYLQNGVQEQWQKVPSTIAVFIAESSLILLDPSSDRYAAINKHLMQSSRINMKDIPFFHDCFWSSSVSFKKDRLWMLSLLHTGMNSEEDSRIYLKEHILEVLLSFYSSPLSAPTMAYLLRRMGFENMLIQRTHYELKKELARHNNLEFVWRQSWDFEETTDIFVHMMPFYSYDIPHTCGPEPAICCQFDFARMHGFLYELCPWRQNPVETNQDNVQERVEKLLDQYRKKSTLYRTNTLLVPLGDDFRYVSVDEAEAQFRNYQILFDYINSNPSLNAEAKFGTLDDYFQTLREEADRINYSRPGEVGSGKVEGFPSLSGDFFTYADRQQDYWSGYYVSRPFFKAVDRVLEHTLRATEMLMALVYGHCHRAHCEKLTTSFAYKLAAARRNLALFQHHDGVTGTAKDHVVEDYGNRMHTSLQDLQFFMSKAIVVLLGVRAEKSEHSPSQFEPEQVRSKFDAQPVHKRIILAHEGTARAVVIFNPLGQTRNEVVMVVVDRPDVTVLDSNWTCIESQVSPELVHAKGNLFTGRHRLHFSVSIPAMGLQTYYIANRFAGCKTVAEPANLKIFSESDSFSCPTSYTCSKEEETEVVEIENHHQMLTFEVKSGLLLNVTRKDGSRHVVGEEIGMYSSTGSGAYLFKPIGHASSIIQSSGDMVVTTGPLMREVFSFPKTGWEETPVSHSTRVYNGINSIQRFLIEKEYHVELLGPGFDDKELIVRYKTDIENKRIFYSDLNGLQMSYRETYDKIPVQGNYYPMPSLAFMQGADGRRFSVHSRQALGAASLKDGWLEIMLDRRLTRDDGRGLGQGVTDNRPMSVLFHIIIESNISSTSNTVSNPSPSNPSLLSHCIGGNLNYPLHMFVAKKAQELSARPVYRSYSGLSASLPCDLHIVSFKVPRPLKFSQKPTTEDPRFVIIFQRRGWDFSYCRKGGSQCSTFADEPVNLFRIFKNLEVSQARATSLNLVHEDVERLGYSDQPGDAAQEGQLLISPMEIMAYKLDFRPHQ